MDDDTVVTMDDDVEDFTFALPPLVLTDFAHNAPRPIANHPMEYNVVRDSVTEKDTQRENANKTKIEDNTSTVSYLEELAEKNLYLDCSMMLQESNFTDLKFTFENDYEPICVHRLIMSRVPRLGNILKEDNECQEIMLTTGAQDHVLKIIKMLYCVPQSFDRYPGDLDDIVSDNISLQKYFYVDVKNPAIQLIEHLQNLSISGLFSDLVLKIDQADKNSSNGNSNNNINNNPRFHKALLAKRSPYFDAALEFQNSSSFDRIDTDKIKVAIENDNDGKSNEIVIPHTSPKVMKALKSYIYTGVLLDIENFSDEMFNILLASDHFQLQDLTKYIFRILEDYIDVSNVSNCIDLALKINGGKKLLQKCYDYAILNLLQVEKEENFASVDAETKLQLKELHLCYQVSKTSPLGSTDELFKNALEFIATTKECIRDMEERYRDALERQQTELEKNQTMDNNFMIRRRANYKKEKEEREERMGKVEISIKKHELKIKQLKEYIQRQEQNFNAFKKDS